MAIKIFIDQGHNPQNPNAGAEASGIREQDINYQVGTRLAELLRSNPNFEVRVSRPTPETQLGTSTASSLAARVNEANIWGADYFISIHANASLSPSASGSEMYVYQVPSTAANLAEALLTGLTQQTGLADRGVFANPSLYVLRRTNMPAVLVELGYITNYNDRSFMVNDPQSFAQGLYNGLLNYFSL